MPGARNKVCNYMEEHVNGLYSLFAFCLAGHQRPQRSHCDASLHGGTSGFVRVIGKQRLLLPDVAGNRLFKSYGNVDDNGHVGLPFLFPAEVTPYL